MLITANDVERSLFRIQLANENGFVPTSAVEFGGSNIKTIGV